MRQLSLTRLVGGEPIRTRKQIANSSYIRANKQKIRAYRAANRERFSKLRREHYLENRDHERETNRRWHRENRDRAREIHGAGKRAYVAKKRGNGGRGVTVVEWREIKELFDHSCAYCWVSGVPLQMDHFEAINRGGRHEPENIVPACAKCNRSKSDNLAHEWLFKMLLSGQLRRWHEKLCVSPAKENPKAHHARPDNGRAYGA